MFACSRPTSIYLVRYCFKIKNFQMKGMIFAWLDFSYNVCSHYFQFENVERYSQLFLNTFKLFLNTLKCPYNGKCCSFFWSKTQNVRLWSADFSNKFYNIRLNMPKMFCLWRAAGIHRRYGPKVKCSNVYNLILFPHCVQVKEMS